MRLSNSPINHPLTKSQSTSNLRSLFEHAWNRVRDYTGNSDAVYGLGVGINEARHWHHLAYGGVVIALSPNPEFSWLLTRTKFTKG